MKAAEKRILEMRRDGRSWDEIARTFNVSIERVKQIYEKVLIELGAEGDTLGWGTLESHTETERRVIAAAVLHAAGVIPIDRCTCGHDDSDGRMDVLRCPVHGVGPF